MTTATTPLDLDVEVHRRANPMTGEWVLVSPHRARRPWQGQLESPPAPASPAHDPTCHLCPGNTRANGQVNPRYEGPYAFDNDFAALQPAGRIEARYSRGLLHARAETGICRVLCYAPEHNVTLARMSVECIRRVVDLWAEENARLERSPEIRAVTLFENRGAMMGASSPHPHGQLWAGHAVPDLVAREGAGQRRYLRRHDRCLLCDYAATELAEGERIVCLNDHFLVVVPFWAVWPFETLVLPRFHIGAIDSLSGAQRDDLAAILQMLTKRYDALFRAPFPYTMGWHQRPTDAINHPEWHLHAHFLPPLLRSATIRKFMVGYELLAGPQRDLTPESAAERLRELKI